MRNISDISDKNTHFMFNYFSFFENSTIYKITWRNIVQLGRPQVTI